MNQTFINTGDDMQWLRDVHLPTLSRRYKSAVIVGNEDSPLEIYVYVKREPRYLDRALIFRQDANGVFRRTRIKRY